MNIGWIGTGIMGAAMAGRLQAGGHTLHVFSRTRAKAEELLARGYQLQTFIMPDLVHHGFAGRTMSCTTLATNQARAMIPASAAICHNACRLNGDLTAGR